MPGHRLGDDILWLATEAGREAGRRSCRDPASPSLLPARLATTANSASMPGRPSRPSSIHTLGSWYLLFAISVSTASRALLRLVMLTTVSGWAAESRLEPSASRDARARSVRDGSAARASTRPRPPRPPPLGGMASDCQPSSLQASELCWLAVGLVGFLYCGVVAVGGALRWQ
jgi:hypothetical protein